MSADEKRQELIKAGSNEVEFLVFHLGGQRYGMNVTKIRQIMVLDKSSLSPVPNQRGELAGLMPFREKTISVVDLAIHLGKEKIVSTDAPELLIVTEFNNRTIGFIVDGVDRIERCSWELFEPIGNSACNADDSKVVGSVRFKDSLILILDLETIMGIIDPSMNLNYQAGDTPFAIEDRNKISILHCDDSAVVQKVLVKSLETAGFVKLHTFPSATQALDYLNQTGGRTVDIIISDIEMPQMDGLAFCKKVKEDNNLKNLPFLFFSSTIDAQMETKCMSVGAAGAFSKPQLKDIIAELDVIAKGRGIVN